MNQQEMNQKELRYIREDSIYLFECPNCDNIIQVSPNELNCRIFRHAVLKSNGQQINPHAPKEECDILINNNLIYGCGLPFKIYTLNDSMYAISCGYIL